MNVLNPISNDVSLHASVLNCTFVLLSLHSDRVHISERTKSAYMIASLVAIISP